jgi:hypothetical protein
MCSAIGQFVCTRRRIIVPCAEVLTVASRMSSEIPIHFFGSRSGALLRKRTDVLAANHQPHPSYLEEHQQRRFSRDVGEPRHRGISVLLRSTCVRQVAYIVRRNGRYRTDLRL